MARQRIYEDAMTPLERRQKSDADRKARGEQRMTAWLDVDAHAALRYLCERHTKAGERADVGAIASAALVALAQSEGMGERKHVMLKRAILEEQNVAA
jgi:hypothetical protein